MRRAPNAWDRFYHRHEAPWRGERPLANLRPWLRGRILELGCGNGKLLRPLRAAGFDVVGLDISWNALQGVGGVLADAQRLPFADGAFGTVLDIHCTGHLSAEGRASALAEARRVLAPGGHLIIERLGPDDLRAGQGTPIEAATRALQDGRTTHFSDDADLRSELEDWTVLDVTEARRTMRLPGGPAVRSSWRAVARAD